MPVGRGLVNDNQNWSISVEWLKQKSDGVNSGSVRVPGKPDLRTEFEQMNLILRGPISEDWTLSVLIPRVEIHKRTISTGARTDLQGLGDVTLYGEYGGADLRWLVGLSLPTGEEAESPGPGLVPPSLLQLGTGTIDPILGVIWNGGDGVGMDPYFDLLAVLPFDDSDAGLQVGQTFSARVGAIWNLDRPITPGVQIEALRREQDRLNGSYLGGTGGTLWTLVPSLQFPLGGGASARIAWRLPLDQDVNGMQLVPGEGIVIEAGWVF